MAYMCFGLTVTWSQDALLLTLLRAVRPDVTAILVRLIEERGIDFLPWLEVALPQGHSVRSCQFAFEDIRRATHQGTAQSSAPSSAPGPYALLQPLYQGLPASLSALGKKSWEQEAQHQAPREIRPRPPRSTDSPKPPVTNGDSFVVVRASQSEGSGKPSKKRGRPSKEDAERREKEYAARGEVYRPKPRKSKKSDNLIGSPLLPTTPREDSPEDRKLTTPQRNAYEITEDSSSSKRKRKRPCVEGTEPEQATLRSDNPRSIQAVAAQSPSDRLLARGGERGNSATSITDEITPSSTAGNR